MDEQMEVSLQDELIADLTVELENEPTFDLSKLKQKVINAIREVKKARKYSKLDSILAIGENIQIYLWILCRLVEEML